MVSAAFMWSCAVVPTAKRVTPSVPTTLSAPPQVPSVAPVSAWQAEIGATTRSTCRELPGAKRGGHGAQGGRGVRERRGGVRP